MFFWFIGLGVVAVAVVFSSPALDYRAVMIGSVIPVVEVPFDRPGPLHSLLGPVVVMTLIMACTVGRRLVRRRWLGVPIGMFMHLVLDGVWADQDAFWWPAFGTDFSTARIPELSRGVVTLFMELVGIAVLVWARRAFGVDNAEAQRRFVRTGQLPRQPTAGA